MGDVSCKTRQKKIGNPISLVGLILFSFTLLSDILRHRAYQLGPAQIIILVFSIALILFGRFVPRINFGAILRSFQINKKRILGYGITFIGLSSVVVTLLFGFLHETTYFLDPVQLFIIGTGLVLLIFGLLIPKIKRLPPGIIDGLIVTGFVIYALLFFLGKWGGVTPIIDISSDSAAISGYAAAIDHPDNFFTDTLLGNSDISLPYRLFLIPVIQVITGLTNDYSLSFILLLPLSIILQLTGFYLLGKKLFNNRLLALMLGIICTVTIQYGVGDYWGIYRDPQPRLIYQSILPFLMLLFLNSLNKPKRWPLIMLLVGLAGYIHILSNPSIAFMFWFSFFFNKPRDYSLRKLLGLQVINGLVYVLTTIPVLWILSSSFSPYFFVDIPFVITRYFHSLWSLGVGILIPLSILISYLILKKIDRVEKNLLVWLGCLWFSALLVPLLEFTFGKDMNHVLIPLDIVRNLRYTIPLYFIIIIYNAHLIIQKARTKNKSITRFVIGVSSLVFLFLFIAIGEYFKVSTYYFKDYAVKAISCFQTGNVFCSSDYEEDAADVLIYIRGNTLVTDEVLAVPYGRLSEQIRYGGERTSSFVLYDPGRQSAEVTESQEEARSLFGKLADMPELEQLQASIDLGCMLGSDYLLFSPTYSDELLASVVGIQQIYNNANFELVKIDSCAN